MNAVVDKLSPSFAYSLWKNFAMISEVPRGSANEQEIVQLLVDFADKYRLKWKKDATGNLVIYKEATEGKERCPVVILQSHVDMVTEKTDQSQHDFSIDPIEWVEDGEWIRANGTTLGADDGIGVAATMAILQSTDISHGAIEALFTVEEETSMAGAMGVDSNLLRGRRLINIDSEDSDVLTVGCAGGINLDIYKTYSSESLPESYQSFEITLSGLKGGHSGCDIHLQRGNAIFVLARVLRELQTVGIRIANFKGGTVDNAIPRSAKASIAVPLEQVETFKKNVEQIIGDIKTELRSVDPTLNIKLIECDPLGSVIGEQEQSNWLKAMHGCLNGVLRVSDDFELVVETSSNLGVFSIDDGVIRGVCFVRSLIDSATRNAGEAIAGHFELAGAQVERRGFFPGWKPEPKSELLDLMHEQYKKLNQKEPKVEVIHAALECGIIGSALGGADMVSIGPDIMNPHSPDERVNVDSVDKFYRLLVSTLENS